MTASTSGIDTTAKDVAQMRLRYDREELIAFRQLDGAKIPPSALTPEFFREQKDGAPLWSPEAWTSARTQGETSDSGTTQLRERNASIVLGPGASRRNWSSGCGTQQGGTRNRDSSNSETTPAAQPDEIRPNGAYRAPGTTTTDRDRDVRFRDRGDFSASRGGRFGSTESETSYSSASRGKARVAAPAVTPSFSARGRVRLDQAGLRSNQLFEGLVGSRGKESQRSDVSGESERRSTTDNDRDRSDRQIDRERGFERDRNADRTTERGFDRDRDRGFDRERERPDRGGFDRDRDPERDRVGSASRGGYRRDRDAPYNAALTGSGSSGDPANRFGSVRRGGSRFDDEPEWMTGGPKDAFDCLELHGLPEDEDRGRRGSDRDEEVMIIGDDDDDVYDDDDDAFGDEAARTRLAAAAAEKSQPARSGVDNIGTKDVVNKRNSIPSAKKEEPTSIKKVEPSRKADISKKDEQLTKSDLNKRDDPVKKNELAKKDVPVKRIEPLKKDDQTKKEETIRKPEAVPVVYIKKDEPLNTVQPAAASARVEEGKKEDATSKALDVDMSKLAGSRFVKWVQPGDEAAISKMQITVVNPAANANTAVSTKQAAAAANSAKPMALKLDDIFKNTSQTSSDRRAIPQSGPANLVTVANVSNTPSDGKAKTVQELESALGIKNDETPSHVAGLDLLLASIGPVTNPNAAVPAANSMSINRGKAQSPTESVGAQRGVAQAQAQLTNQIQSSAQVLAAQIGQPQANATLTRPNSIYDSASNVNHAKPNQSVGVNPQSQLTDSVQRFFLAQQFTNTGIISGSNLQTGTLQQPMGNTIATQKPAGNGNRSVTPNIGAPPTTGVGAATGWSPAATNANIPRTLNINSATNPTVSRVPNSSASLGSQNEVPTPVTPTLNITNEQVTNVISQLTNMVLSRFNASHAGSQQREQAAAAFSASVVQAAVQMFVTQLLKSLDNPTAFLEQLNAMRTNLPIVIRQFVASGIDPQLAEQFLGTIISVAPYAVALLCPNAATAQQLIAAAVAQQPSTPTNAAVQPSLLSVREQLNLLNVGQPQPASLQHQMTMAGLTQQHAGLAAPTYPQQAFGASAGMSQSGSQMASFSSQMGSGQMLGNSSGQSTGTAFLSAAQQQQLIESSLAKRAAMNNAGQPPQSSAFALTAAGSASTPRAADFAFTNTSSVGTEKRPILAASGQQFVPTQVLRQLAAAQQKTTLRMSDNDETTQQPAMRPITKASRDAVDINTSTYASGQQSNNAAMQQQAVLLRLAAMQQAASLQATNKP